MGNQQDTAGETPAQVSRRRFLTRAGALAGLSGLGLLMACQQPETVTVTPAAAKPATTPAGTGASPAAGASPVIAPAPGPTAPPASPPAKPAASPAASPGASPVAAGGVAAGKPMYQQDPVHTGRSPHAGPRRAQLARTFDTGQPQFRPADAAAPTPDIQSSVAVAPDGTIYATNFPGFLFALKDGASRDALDLAWSFRPAGSSPRHSTPAIGRDGTVYVHFSRGMGAEAVNRLHAVRAPASGNQGQEVWSVDLGNGQAGGPTGLSPTIAADGTIYMLGPTGRLHAIAPDGKVRWTAQTGPSLRVAPAVAPDGTIYTTSVNGKLYAVAPPAGAGTEGSVKWTFDFGENLGPTPLLAKPVAGPPTRGQDAIGSAASPTVGPDGAVYVGASNSNFYAVGPDGKRKWLFEAERELAGIWSSSCLSADNSTLYFGANKGGIYAVNAADGKLKWQFDVFASIYSSPTLDSRGTLYTGSTIGHVYAMDAANGQEVFDFNGGGPQIWTTPAIRPDGSLVTADRNGRVLVLAAG